MKKNVWAKVLSLMLALVCVMGLAACGDKGGSSSAAGVYNFQTLEMGGMSMDMDQMIESGMLAEDDVKITLDLKSDGNFTLDMSALDESQSMDGTWKENGGNIELTVEGETITATLADGVITMAAEGLTMTFKK